MKTILFTLAASLVASTRGAEVPDCPIQQFNGERMKVIFYPNPDDCSKYFQCIEGRLYNGTCTEDMVWNPKAESCDWPSNYKCSGGNKLSTAAHASNRRGKPVEADGADVKCPPSSADGSHNVTFFPNEEDCHKYWECDNGQLLEAACPEGLVWVQELSTCDWEYLHPCGRVPKAARSWFYTGTLDRHQVVIPQPVRGAPERQSSGSR